MILSDSRISASLAGVKSYLIVAFICISLITNANFSYVYICVAFAVKSLFLPFAHFKIGLFVFSLVNDLARAHTSGYVFQSEADTVSDHMGGRHRLPAGAAPPCGLLLVPVANPYIPSLKDSLLGFPTIYVCQSVALLHARGRPLVFTGCVSPQPLLPSFGSNDTPCGDSTYLFISRGALNLLGHLLFHV